jgi:hypothetical protein
MQLSCVQCGSTVSLQPDADGIFDAPNGWHFIEYGASLKTGEPIRQPLCSDLCKQRFLIEPPAAVRERFGPKPEV